MLDRAPAILVKTAAALERIWPFLRSPRHGTRSALAGGCRRIDRCSCRRAPDRRDGSVGH
jgi:hypothetical protein